MIRASDWLNRKVMLNGRKASRSQRMAWPRAGVSTQDGEIAPDEIPAEVVEACCELAGFFVEQDYLAPLDRGGDIASLSVNVISIAYNGTAPAEYRRGPHPDLIQPSQLRSRPASSAARVRTPSKST